MCGAERKKCIQSSYMTMRTFVHSHIALPQSQQDSNECSHHKQATEHQDNDGLCVQSIGIHIALQLCKWLEKGGRVRVKAG